jgi:hypothetical protein
MKQLQFKKISFSGFLLLIFILQFAVSCTQLRQPAAQSGIWYIWKSQDTLESVSKELGTSSDKIRKENNIFDPDDLIPGMRIWISASRSASAKEKEEKAPVEASSPGKMIWPSQGTISSGFGMRHGRMHTGIDITRDKGTEIRAALGGRVEFTGRQNGFGRTIILNHGRGIKTLYGHNAKIYVRKGMRVKKGAVIAKMGASGRSTGIHLHFEVQKNGKARNPLRYLPIR